MKKEKRKERRKKKRRSTKLDYSTYVTSVLMPGQ